MTEKVIRERENKMSLYLGTIGRKIVGYVVSHDKPNRVVDKAVRLAHYLDPHITPGITRESFLLFERSKAGDQIQVRAEGFFCDTKYIAGNEFMSAKLLAAGIESFEITEEASPESLAEFCRQAASLTSTFFFPNNISRKVFASFLVVASLDLASRIFVNSQLQYLGFTSRQEYSEFAVAHHATLFDLVNVHHFLDFRTIWGQFLTWLTSFCFSAFLTGCV